MQNLCAKADAYIAANQNTVDKRYRLAYHAMPPVGWINDPNGFCVWNGEFHLFYQHYPYDTVWGPMHWGHWKSEDLIHWTDLPVAMAPDSECDRRGCFSGSALPLQDKLILMYTGVHVGENGLIQEQCIAQSEDGMRFTKWDCNPVIGEEALPDDICSGDFRDPKVFTTPEGYGCIVAAKGKESGKILAFISTDLKEWVYCGTVIEKIGMMAECPDYFRLDGKDFLLSCVIGPNADMQKIPGKKPSIYFIGEMDEHTYAFTAQQMGALDYGPSFYAPQTVLDQTGRRILIAWMRNWVCDSRMPTDYLGHGWAGAMTIPRVLTLEDGRLRQRPVEEMVRLRRNKVEYQDREVVGRIVLPGLEGSHKEIDVTLEVSSGASVTIYLFEDQEEHLSVHYDRDAQVMTLDRGACGHSLGEGDASRTATMPVMAEDGKIRLQIYVDTCSVELFVNDGKAVMSALAFPKGNGQGTSFHAKGKVFISALDKWDLIPYQNSSLSRPTQRAGACLL